MNPLEELKGKLGALSRAMRDLSREGFQNKIVQISDGVMNIFGENQLSYPEGIFIMATMLLASLEYPEQFGGDEPISNESIN